MGSQSQTCWTESDMSRIILLLWSLGQFNSVENSRVMDGRPTGRFTSYDSMSESYPDYQWSPVPDDQPEYPHDRRYPPSPPHQPEPYHDGPNNPFDDPFFQNFLKAQSRPQEQAKKQPLEITSTTTASPSNIRGQHGVPGHHHHHNTQQPRQVVQDQQQQQQQQQLPQTVKVRQRPHSGLATKNKQEKQKQNSSEKIKEFSLMISNLLLQLSQMQM